MTMDQILRDRLFRIAETFEGENLCELIARLCRAQEARAG